MDKYDPSVAAASIIAYVERDEILKAYDKKYPAFMFLKHKGYGTKQHQRFLKEFGPTEFHFQVIYEFSEEDLIKFKEFSFKELVKLQNETKTKLKSDPGNLDLESTLKKIKFVLKQKQKESE